MMRFNLIFLSLIGVTTARAQVDSDKLQRGLIVTHRDIAKTEVVRLEPTIALNLGADESAHPRLGAGSGCRWEGYINLTRADTYRFRVHLRGGLKLKIGDKEVLSAESKGAKVELLSGPEVRLEAGVVPIVAEFTRQVGVARLELLWSSKTFREEPLPFDVLGHLPTKTPARLQADTLAEEGRFLAEEHSCVRCHQSASKIALGLQSRLGPDLSKVGERVHGEWMYRWLESPKKLRPGSVMPELFSADDNGAVERYAVTRYLMSLGGPLKESAKPADVKDRIDRGRQTFMSVGCVSCHGPVAMKLPMREDEEARPFVLHGEPRLYSFKGMGGKTTPEKLTRFLLDPRVTNPGGRMPHMLLQQKEADDLAHFLCDASGAKDHKMPDAPAKDRALKAFQSLKPTADEVTAFARLPEAEQWANLGKGLVRARNCVACHTIAPEGKPLLTVIDLPKLDAVSKKTSAGCLADDDKQRGTSPRFGFSENERKALRAFLNEGLSGVGMKAPAHNAEVSLRRFNCLSCHQLDGEGGLSPGLVEQLRKFEKAENAEAVVPPPLTGVGHKLRTPWLREVLTKAGRARPWMGLRMPQFGEANVGHLPEALAVLEGVDPLDAVHKVSTDGDKVGAGRFLVGKQGFGCVSCHDIAGVPNHGTRGPDLATMGERVRYDWYLRWMENAQRLQPGTRMPTVFQDGKSLIPHVLKGNADAQAEAVWAYLSLGSKLTLPEGVGASPGLVLNVKDRPLIFRTFLPEAGTRAIAVGYPDGLSLAFDATRCRTSYAWTGNFLDVSPVWNERGGNPARLLGPKLWSAPPGHPWAITTTDNAPDFTARLRDPGFGGDDPELKWHEGEKPLRFDGYSTDSQGRPTFRYRIALKAQTELTVEEKPEPLRSTAGVGLLRQFNMQVPAKHHVWMLAGESSEKPRFVDETGKRSIVVTQGKGQVQLLRIRDGAQNLSWELRQSKGGWQILLKVPPSAEASKHQLGVAVWVPHRDDPALIKELLTR